MSEKLLAQLGDEVVDNVTGFRGIVVARTKWLHGCARLAVQPKVGKDGAIKDSVSFDEVELKVVKRGVIKPDSELVVNEGKPIKGGPRPEMSRAKEPKRASI